MGDLDQGATELLTSDNDCVPFEIVPLPRAMRGCLSISIAVVALRMSLPAAWGFSGATVPWTTYEAEDMATSGTVLGPQYAPYLVTSESSGRKCVRLSAVGDYVEFAAQANANAIVVRYSVPDTADGAGTNYTLSLYTNGVFVEKLPLTSKYSCLYGSYPFTNNPAAGSPRNFYDEVHTNSLTIQAGDWVRLQKESGDLATNYIIDLVDLENVPAPLTAPGNSLSVTSYGAVGDGATDCTAAFQNCINAAPTRPVWIPAGTYVISGNINLPSNTTLQGAGLWYSRLIGNASLYNTPSRRLNLNGAGTNIHLADFSITGFLNYRNDQEGNDGLGGAYGTGSTIVRLWVEHTKAAAWIRNSRGLVVDGCRFRNTLADGINLNTGMRNATVTNCTARGTGDDCFAIWPAAGTQSYQPGLNVITHCTGQLPFLANGGAIYGGADNRLEDCLFQDMPYGSGILISTTFPVGTNAFSGTTIAQSSDLIRCGGYDVGYGWRGALQVCLDNYTNGIPGVLLNGVNISNSVSDGFSVIGGTGTLSNALAAQVNIPNYGVGVSGRHGFWAASGTVGSLTVSNSTIVEYRNDSTRFALSVVNGVIVQTSPPGLRFAVDGTAYTSAQAFTWNLGSLHTLSAGSPQTGGTGIQYVWDAWSDGGTLSHTVSPRTNTTYTANFQTQYYLRMIAGPGGDVSPTSGWTNAGTSVAISATASNGYSFGNWTGSGSGAYSGPNSAATIAMNEPITEVANFVLTPTRLISLAGNLAFGDVAVGTASNRTLTVSNAGNSTLTITGIGCPGGFSTDWSGAIPANGSTNVLVAFAPSAATNYSGNLTVDSDATGGSSTLSLSGTGIARTNQPPPAQKILGVSVNEHASVTLIYATTPGAPYHVEAATNLSSASWTPVAGSATNAAESVVTFTDVHPPAGSQAYYRTASP